MKDIFKLRVVMLLSLFLLCFCVLTGCNRGNDEPSTPTMGGVQDGQQTVIPGYDGSDSSVDGEVPPPDFGLTSPGTPNFSDMGSGQDEGMYTIEDGYAYALDPATFEKTGPALDPLTHEVVNPQPGEGDGNTDATNTDTGDASTTTEPPAGTDTDGQNPPSGTGESNAKVPEGQKLPNTGIFLEDD